MNKISKMYINIGYCCLGKTVWQGQPLQVTLFLGLCWPCVCLCVRVPCEGWERQADQQHTGSHGALDGGSLVVILYWVWLFVLIVDVSLVFSLAQKYGRTSQAWLHTLVSPYLGSWVRRILNLRTAWAIEQDLGLKTNNSTTQGTFHQVHPGYTLSPSVSASNWAQVICTKQVTEVMADQRSARTPCTKGLASRRGFWETGWIDFTAEGLRNRSLHISKSKD